MRFTSRNATVEIDPLRGGRLTSLKILGDEILGAAPPRPSMPPDIFDGSFVMAPFVGRTEHGRFVFDGAEWEVPHNIERHAMHGVSFDREWSIDGDDVVIALDDRWPFGGYVRQSVHLADDHVVIRAELHNDHRAMPAILGFHPWFVRTLASGEEAVLDFRPGIQYECDDDGIPIGTRVGPGPRPWDDSFTDVERPPTIRWGDRLIIEITTGGDHWIVCETLPDAFCVEPLSGPVNGLGSGRFTVVEPGAPLVHEMTVRWSRPEE